MRRPNNSELLNYEIPVITPIDLYVIRWGCVMWPGSEPYSTVQLALPSLTARPVSYLTYQVGSARRTSTHVLSPGNLTLRSHQQLVKGCLCWATDQGAANRNSKGPLTFSQCNFFFYNCLS